jgi:site-specific recombinase XerD
MSAYQRQPAAAIADLVDLFCSHMAGKGRSANTLRAYRSDLRDAAAWLPGPAATITTADLESYFQSLTTAGLAPKTRNRRLGTLTAFFRWMQQRELRVDNPADLLDAATEDRALPRPVVLADRRAIDQAIAAADERARLVLWLLRETGMRAGEALGLDVGDVDLTPGREALALRGTKTNQDRIVVLTPDSHPKSLRGLRARLKELGPAPHQPLFVSSRKQRLDYDTLHYHWGQALIAAGLVDADGAPRYTLHQLRHTHATELLAEGVPERLVQRALGHTDPRSTQRYAQLDDAQLREALSRRRR